MSEERISRVFTSQTGRITLKPGPLYAIMGICGESGWAFIPALAMHKAQSLPRNPLARTKTVVIRLGVLMRVTTHALVKFWEDSVSLTSMIEQPSGKFTKVIFRMKNAEELWETMSLLHRQDETFLSSILPREILPAGQEHDVHLNHAALQGYVEAWVAAGNKIKMVSPGASSRGKIRTTIDIDELISGLDSLPAEGEEEEESSAVRCVGGEEEEQENAA